MIAETSSKAYLASTETRHAQCERLYRLYQSHREGLTDKEAARIMGFGENGASKVSARRPDINKNPKLGRIEKIGKKYDEGSRVTVNVYGLISSTLFAPERVNWNVL